MLTASSNFSRIVFRMNLPSMIALAGRVAWILPFGNRVSSFDETQLKACIRQPTICARRRFRLTRKVR